MLNSRANRSMSLDDVRRVAPSVFAAAPWSEVSDKYRYISTADILARLLTVRRTEDRAPDLYTTFNRVQENVIRGGIAGRNANGRRMRTRAVTGIDSDNKFNRALWRLTEEMARLVA